jgi:hypothetical protein
VDASDKTENGCRKFSFLLLRNFNSAYIDFIIRKDMKKGCNMIETVLGVHLHRKYNTLERKCYKYCWFK